MQREDRYLVLKRADIEKYLTSEQRRALSDLADQIAMGRALDGRLTDKRFVCFADDWPEYEVVWKMLEDRVDGTASPRSPGGYGAWQPIETLHDGKVVLLHSPEWVDADFNPEGVRDGFRNEGPEGPIYSARWCPCQDVWETDEDSKEATHWVPQPKAP